MHGEFIVGATFVSLFLGLLGVMGVPIVLLYMGLPRSSMGRHGVAVLLLMPCTVVALAVIMLLSVVITPIDIWLTISYRLVNGLAILSCVAFWAAEGVGLGIWLLGDRVTERHALDRAAARAFKRVLVTDVLAAGLAVGAICTYLSTYTTLEDAVRKEDLKLTVKRLRFNLLGVGPNNGYIEDLSAGAVGSSLLRLSVEANDLYMTELLVDHGADVDQSRGSALLKLAIKANNVPMAELLIDNGVDVNRSSGHFDEHPLLTALRHADLAMVKLLVSHGANPSTVSALSEHQLALVLRRGNGEAVAYLRELAEKVGGAHASFESPMDNEE